MRFLFAMLYYVLLGVLSFFVGRLLPRSMFRYDRYPYKSFPFERDGKIYNKLGIRKWQNRVPDMSKILVRWIPPKAMTKETRADLPLMIHETCVAEFIHVMLIVLGLAVLFILPGFWGILLTVIYILLFNIPFILIQRFNRPRLVNLWKKKTAAKSEIS